MLSELHTRFPAESVALRDGSAVVFRLLTTEDGERLARFYESIPREDLRFYCPHVLDREHGLANAVAADEAGQFVLVVEHENEIAGYAWVRGDGESGGFGMCMRRDFQGRGAGGKLVRRLFEIVDEVGPGVVNLTVQTANQAAVALYTRIGFRVTKKGMRGPKSMFGFPDEPQSWMQRVRSPHEECRGTVRIHCADAGGRLVTKAAELFARELLERTGLVAESADARSADIVLDVDGELLPESYRLAGVTPLRVSGGDGRGVIYGVGRLLRSSQLEPECFRPTEWRGTSVPTNPARAMYFASHFHNFYHVAPIEKVVRYVEDLALYGCNALSVWFDMHHYSGMDDPDAVAMVTRLRRLLEAANGVGMGAALTMLGNEGFTTTPENVKA
ncbi:MAG: GNAT family N-acetyltransferase, partial [Lentisphaeria bacterium]|nr:GNAT family N-acetyltransferase [Lentisphaeria bacterium]